MVYSFHRRRRFIPSGPLQYGTVALGDDDQKKQQFETYGVGFPSQDSMD